MTRPRRGISAILLALLLAATTGDATAAVGPQAPRLDRAFGQDGRIEPNFGPSFARAAFQAVQVRADGSIAATRGKAEVPEAVDSHGRTLRADRNGGEMLERVNPDGSVDDSFTRPLGPQGPFVRLGFTIEAILPLPSGKIVVAGTKRVFGEGEGLIKEVDVARYEETGLLDPTFGVGGESAVPVGEERRYEKVAALTVGAGEDVVVALQEGPPVVIGETLVGGGSRVVGIGGDGRLDPGYASGGVLRSADSIGAVVGLPDGGLLIAGSRPGAPLTSVVDQSDLYLTRLTPVGAPDPSFGEHQGTTTVDLGPLDFARSLLLRADGSIVVGGATTTPHLSCGEARQYYCEETPVLVGFGASGAVDRGFGADGVLRLDSQTFAMAPVQALGALFLREVPGGDLLAGGGTWASGFLAEVGADGQLDPRYGNGGLLTEVRPRKSVATAEGIALDRGGRILAYGQTSAGGMDGNGLGSGAVFRLRPDGSVDHSFAAGRGYVRMPGNQVAFTVDDRGRALVLAGKYSTDTVTRVTAAGRLDQSFGTEGVASLPEHSSVFAWGQRRKTELAPRVIAALPDGGVLVMGEAWSEAGPLRIELVRLTDRGRVDRSFGHGGLAMVAVGHEGICSAQAMKVLPDGRILLAGSLRGGHRPHERQTAAVIRLLADGSLDRSFGNGGATAIEGRGQGVLSALAVGPGGEVIVGGSRVRNAGRRFVPGTYTPLAARLSPDGRLDRRFADRAVRTLRGPAAEFLAPGQIVLVDGRIIFVFGSTPNAVVYTADGRFERELAFGKDRKPSTGIEGVAVRRGGLIVASKTAGHRSFTLRRLLFR